MLRTPSQQCLRLFLRQGFEVGADRPLKGVMLFELEGPDSWKSPAVSVVGQEVLNLIVAARAGLWLLLHVPRNRLPVPVVSIDIDAH